MASDRKSDKYRHQFQNAFPDLVMGPLHRWNDPPADSSKINMMHKQPMCKWKDMTKTNHDAILGQRSKGNLNVFTKTGKGSGLFVVDIDVKDHGVEAWKMLQDEHGQATCNHVVRTPSGGFHFYFAYDDRLNSIPNKAKFHYLGKEVGIDVRTNGGIIVMPPTVGTDNKPYEVLRCPSEDESRASTVPQWLVDFFLKKQNEKNPKKRTAAQAEAAAEGEQEHAECDKKLSVVEKILRPHLIDACMRLCSLIKPGSIHKYDDWIHFAFALHNTLGVAGWPLFEEVSKRNDEKYDMQACKHKYFRETAAKDDPAYGVWTLYEWAKRDTTEVEYEMVMFGVNDRESNREYHDRTAMRFLNLLPHCTTAKEEREIKLCLQQFLLDTLVIVEQSIVLKRKVSWETKEPFFDGMSQAKFFESCRQKKIAYSQQSDHDADSDDDGSSVEKHSLYDAIFSIFEDLSYNGLCFYPINMNGESGEVHFMENHRAFNMFMGFRSWKLLRGKTCYKDFRNVEILRQHIYKVLFYEDGDEDQQKKNGDWFIKGLAAKFCRPWERINKVPAFISEEGGVGKSAFLLWIMDNIFGTMYADEITNEHQLDPKFNARARFMLWALYDDIGKKLNLKAMATRKRMRIELKGVDCEMNVPDFRDMFVCSNTFNPVTYERGERRAVPSECFTGFTSKKNGGKEYLNTLFSVLETERGKPNLDAVEDFAFYLTEIWKKDPTWDVQYTPTTAMMRKKDGEIKQSLTVQTLRNYGENYAHDQLVPNGNGLPKSCLFAFHKHLHGVNIGAQEQGKFVEEVESIFKLAKISCEDDRIEHKPVPWTTEVPNTHYESGVATHAICKCTKKNHQQRGWKRLTVEQLCGAVRKWEGSAVHFPQCKCTDRIAAEQTKAIVYGLQQLLLYHEFGF